MFKYASTLSLELEGVGGDWRELESSSFTLPPPQMKEEKESLGSRIFPFQRKRKKKNVEKKK